MHSKRRMASDINTKLRTGIAHTKSWASIVFGIKRSKIKVTGSSSASDFITRDFQTILNMCMLDTMMHQMTLI